MGCPSLQQHKLRRCRYMYRKAQIVLTWTVQAGNTGLKSPRTAVTPLHPPIILLRGKKSPQVSG